MQAVFPKGVFLRLKAHHHVLLTADVELGLASRSDLLQILNHTVHGGKSVLGNDNQQESENTRRLDMGMFPSSSEAQLHNLSPPPADSPGGLFRMDSSPRDLVSSPSALFPISLDSAPSSSSAADFALNPSVSSGNIFTMTDTAHDDDPSVHGAMRADPPPDSQQQQTQQRQQQLTQQLLQQQQQENEYQLQPPAQQGPPPRRKLYAYGIADPEYMSLPCKMSMKHARVTVNHETNNRLYGKKLPGQVWLFSSSFVQFLVAFKPDLVVAFKPDLVVAFKPDLLVAFKPGLVVAFKPDLVFSGALSSDALSACLAVTCGTQPTP